MRAPLIAGNWKMYKIINEAVQLANGIKRELLDFMKAEVVICPPFTNLSAVYEVIMETNIKLGAQDLFWEKEGAFTGAISAIMLKDCGCEYGIIGHSERRKYFGESDEAVNKKVKSAQEVGLTPIMCVGETQQERQADKTIEVVTRQLTAGLEGLESEDTANLVIAYEPVWAIGTGITASPSQAEEVHKFIRSWIEDKFSNPAAANIRILYGGSVKPENIRELMQQPDIDGALVGGASLKSSSFVNIVKNAVIE
ncbi:MAG: triose-phosphate isomerase [Candidatus Omnitrophota bacterium]|nr:MAG: triose-phosphate isomerase [Candidatus Omnitrophota bacterium]